MVADVARHNRGTAESNQPGESGDADTVASAPDAPGARVGSADADATATVENRSGPTTRRPSRAGWWRGVRAGRGYAAKVIVWAALVVALVLGLAAVLLGFGANEHNVLVRGIVSAARWLDGPFGDLFTFHDHIKQSIVNWVIAAVAYLAAGGILARLIRP